MTPKKLYQVEYGYETPSQKGTGRLALIADSEVDAATMAKMIGGADSRMTSCSVVEVKSGFLRLGENVHETENEIKARRDVERAKSVAPRFVFEVAAKCEVVAADRWDAYRKFGGMVKQEVPPPGLKRKVLSMEPCESTSRREANEVYTATRIFQGGKAGS